MVIEVFIKGSSYKALVALIPRATQVKENGDWLFVDDVNGGKPGSYSLRDYEFRITS